ncbi:MAG: hypothetical protein HRF46_15520 [Acidobacteriota bacterium]|jgi:hypothetical protein
MPKLKAPLIFLSGLLVAGLAAAEDMVLPAFAYQAGGKGGNRWTTEVYIANPHPVEVSVRLVRAIVSDQRAERPCLPRSVVERRVPAYTTIAWPASQIARDLGCVDRLLGALVFAADRRLEITGHMVNERGAMNVSREDLLRGFGQVIPGIPWSELPGPRVVWMLPGLIWHPGPCGPPLFDLHLHLVNPGTAKATVRLGRDRAGRPGRLTINGVEVTTPYELALEGESWRQLRVSAPEPLLTVCMAPELVDLFFTSDQPVACYVSVVDRTTNDPRTVLPVATLE